MRIRIDLDPEAQAGLIRSSVRERRPVHMQAEVLLRRALGLPDCPGEHGATTAKSTERPKQEVRHA